MQLVELGVRSMLIAIFAISAASKLRSRAAFDAFVDSIPALPGLRGARVVIAGVAVAALEVATVALLVGWPAGGLVLAAGLLIAFAAVMIAAGDVMVCRCFGSEAQPVRTGHVVRNAWLISASLSALAMPTGTWQSASLVAIAVGAIAGGLVTRWDDLMFLFRPLAGSDA